MLPTKGRIVLVTTPGRSINGQEEHAAVVTQVWGTDEHSAINVMVLPGSGVPFALGSVIPESAAAASPQTPFWHWPERI